MGLSVGTVPQNNRNTGYLQQVRNDIKRYKPDDRPALLSFRRTMYGPESGRSQDEYVRWLYEDASYTAARDIPLWVYSKNGQIEGQQGGIRVRLKVGAAYYDGLWTIDLMVSPPLRLRGVGAVLSNVAYEDSALSLGVEISDAARKTFLRAGWIDLETVPLYVRPLDAAAFFGQRWNSSKGRIVGHGADLALATAGAVSRTGAMLAGVRMEEVSLFDERVDHVWEHASLSYPVIGRRDSAYLNWRFARYPEAGLYRLFLFSRGKTVIGYAVLRDGKHHELSAGYVVDYLCPPIWTYALFAHCIAFFQRRGMKAVSCVHLNPSPLARAALSALGFVRRDSGWPLMLRPSGLDEETLAVLGRPENWFLTGGDSDLDRPREGTVYAQDLPSSIKRLDAASNISGS